MKKAAGDLRKSEVTGKILQAFYTVYNALGYGFLEKVYENALIHELIKMGITAISQSPPRYVYGRLWAIILLIF
jgi:GxxExxY protein